MGKFEKLVYLGPCSDSSSLLKILRAVTNKLPLDPGVRLDHVVSQLPARLTGADLKAVASDAFYAALRETVQSIESGISDASTARVVVTESHLLHAADAATSSVSSEQLKQYEAYNSQLGVEL
ncbi:hypothetical protein FHG87_004424 [Trinorchestia longiramus]|nr:hypothetical protein FHG87_004424 [Trinorchestia longiramus]